MPHPEYSQHAYETYAYEFGSAIDPCIEIPVRPVLDRLTKQCEALHLSFRLSDREAQVMELIVRGNTVTHIAGQLRVSENTVRTYAKRIYSKCDVHSKQELVDLVHHFKPVHLTRQ